MDNNFYALIDSAEFQNAYAAVVALDNRMRAFDDCDFRKNPITPESIEVWVSVGGRDFTISADHLAFESNDDLAAYAQQDAFNEVVKSIMTTQHAVETFISYLKARRDDAALATQTDIADQLGVPLSDIVSDGK